MGGGLRESKIDSSGPIVEGSGLRLMVERLRVEDKVGMRG